MKRTLLCISLFGLCVAACAQDGNQESSLTQAIRNPKIEERQTAISEILKANRLVQKNLDPTSGTYRFERVTQPPSFDANVAQQLRDVKASDEQVARLRKINEQIWNLRDHDSDAPDSETSRQVKALLAEQEVVLTPEQKQALAENVQKRVRDLQSRISSTSGPGEWRTHSLLAPPSAGQDQTTETAKP